MKVFPATKEGRYRLLLFPFEAYVVLAFGFAIFMWAVYGDWVEVKELAYRYALLEYGYVGCIVALLLGAVTLRDRRTRWSAMIFAGVGLICFVLLLPATAVAKTRSARSAPNNTMQPMGASRLAQAHLESPLRLAPTADGGRWNSMGAPCL